MLIQEHAFCLSIEKLLNKNKFFQTYSHIRTLFDELTRILNHLMALGSHTIDIGAMAPMFWGFEEREKIMEFYERISGARMHAAFYKPLTLNLTAFSTNLFLDILIFINNCFTSINEIHNLIIYNKIWKTRMVNIGILQPTHIFQYGITGVLARSTGLKYDLRLSLIDTYGSYYYLKFKSFNGLNGDTFDRYLLRINEIIESLNLGTQLLNSLHKINNFSQINILPNFYINKKNNQNHMESLINHFKYWSQGISPTSNTLYTAIESPKGEFGLFLISDGTNKPFKCKIRSPAYYNLYALTKILPGSLLADLITLIGSVDVVFGEVDR